MSLADDVVSLQRRVDGLNTLILGARRQGQWYAFVGSNCIFGAKVTEGYSAADMILALDGAASGDEANLNPDRSVTPVYPEEYSNLANIYGELFMLADQNLTTLENTALTVSTAPGAGYHRYDIVYGYVGNSGAAVAIAAGTPVLVGSPPSTPSDPEIPHGAFALARVYVEADVTGIADAKITDLRDFSGRLSSGDIPLNSQSADYTTVLSDRGIYHPGADTTARTWTIDSNANVPYRIGKQLTFINDTSGGVITIAIASDTLVLAGAGTTGSRTLAANGKATAVKMTATRWIIDGTGLT